MDLYLSNCYEAWLDVSIQQPVIAVVDFFQLLYEMMMTRLVWICTNLSTDFTISLHLASHSSEYTFLTVTTDADRWLLHQDKTKLVACNQCVAAHAIC